MKGIYRELYLTGEALLLGFVLRMAYEPLKLFRAFAKHRHWQISLEDIIFWSIAGTEMFAMLYRENKGIPRLYLIASMAAGMYIYHAGPGKIICPFIIKTAKKISRYFLRVFGRKGLKNRKNMIE